MHNAASRKSKAVKETNLTSHYVKELKFSEIKG